MISLWACLNETDIADYASSLVLPDYLAHLQLAPFDFGQQQPCLDGQEPLRLTYRGDGRLEEYVLCPKDHALGMVSAVCPHIESSKIRLPQDDARWHWDSAETASPRLRVYFEPATRRLYPASAPGAFQDSYVSVTREQAFVGRSAVEAYLNAWLERLGLADSPAEFTFDTATGGIQFVAGAAAGQMYLADQTVAEELIRFAGIEPALAEVGRWVKLDLDRAVQESPVVRDDGICIQLARQQS